MKKTFEHKCWFKSLLPCFDVNFWCFQGLESETATKGINLGNFSYSTVGKPIQQFEVQVGFVYAYVWVMLLNQNVNTNTLINSSGRNFFDEKFTYAISHYHTHSSFKLSKRILYF